MPASPCLRRPGRLRLRASSSTLSAACSVMGAAKGLAITGSPVVAVIMGVLTATFGGILRDLLAGEPSVLLRPEIYVSAALAGAGLYTLGDLAGLPPLASDLAGFVA